MIDDWWQTELGWRVLAPGLGLGAEPASIGAAGYSVTGCAFDVLDQNGNPVVSNTTGSLCIPNPLPPGSFRSLWRNHEGFEGYSNSFPGYQATGDVGVHGADCAYRMMGRSDDIINVAGHRLQTGQIEEVVAGCECVVERAVIRGHDELKGEAPVELFVPAKKGRDPVVAKAQIVSAIRTVISLIASLRAIHSFPVQPKTRSAKILRNLIRAITNGEDYFVTQTIEDPVAIELVIAVRADGLANRNL